MILGLRTVIYPAADLALGPDWYARRLRDDAVLRRAVLRRLQRRRLRAGPDPRRHARRAGGLAYWGVPDVAAEVARFESELGATVAEPVTDVGGGIRVAAVLDPFGNRVGLIENPHFNRDDVR